MGGRGARSSLHGKQVKSINAQIKTLDAEINKRKQWGKQVYDAELKRTNEILADAKRKYELKINGYHSLVAQRTKLKKQLDIINRIKK